jgi:dihydroxyacetone kinase
MPLQQADELADHLLESILVAHRLSTAERIVVLLNNLGATTAMEMAIFARRILSSLQRHGLIVERVYSGTFVSSLEAAGVSVSILRVDDERLHWLDAPTSAPAWPNVCPKRAEPILARTFRSSLKAHDSSPAMPVPARSSGSFERAIESACRAIIDAEERLTELDRVTGDGDLGTNLARAAKAVERTLSLRSGENPVEMLRQIGLTLQQEIGGSSGPLYGALFARAAQSLGAGAIRDPKSWAVACRDGCQAITEIGGALPGERTMLDALVPFAQTLNKALDNRSIAEAVQLAARAAEEHAEATANMIPLRGRSRYLGERVLGHPDPGAIAAAIWLRAIASSLVNPSA